MILDWVDDEKRTKVVLLLLVTYISYALVYITIQFALESFPPLVLTSFRYFIAGGIFFIWSHRSKKDWGFPSLKDWKIIAIVSFALMMVRGGFLSYSELFAQSGLVATLQGTVPLWTISLSWLIFKEKRPTFRIVIGILCATAGIVLLSLSHAFANDAKNMLYAIIFITLSIVGGVFGILYSRERPLDMPKVKAIAYQMLLAAVVLLGMSTITGEFATFHVADITMKAGLSLAILTLVGSILGFASYFWLAQNTSVTLASSYVYVEPIIAVGIGVFFGGEKFTDLLFFGIALIIFSVFFIMGKKGFRG